MRRTPSLILALLIAAGTAGAQVNFNFTDHTVDSEASAVTSGDFNRDGKPDFAVISEGLGGTNQVTVFLATTAGHYPATGVRYPAHDSPALIRTADVNNDGKLDLIVGGFYNFPGVSVLLGKGDGTFMTGADFPTTYRVYEMDLGDFNHDGNIDIALIECDSSNICDVRAELGKGNGTFTPGYKIQTTGYAQGLSVRDMNGDGNLDWILVRSSQTANDVLIFGGDGTGRFPAFTKVSPPIVCTGEEGAQCFEGLTGVAVADFNNDGRLDFAVLQEHSCGSSCDTADLYSYKNTGSGFSFSRVQDIKTSLDGGPLVAADLDGDGNLDLIYRNGVPDPVYVTFRGNGDGTFGGLGANLPVPSGFGLPIVRDLNLDSRHDVILARDDGGTSTTIDVGLNTSAFTNCPPPSSANLAAKICTPFTNAAVSSPVLIRASGNSPAGVGRLELWVDGVKQYQKWNDQLAKRLTLTPGSHRVVVVAVDLYKGTAKSTITVNVQ